MLSGCTGKYTDALDLVNKTPEVQLFLEKNPGATVKVVYLDKDYVSQNINSIRGDCGEQMGEVPYYYATITDKNQVIEIYADESATKVLCILKPANLIENNNGAVNNSEQRFSDAVCNMMPNNAMHLVGDYVAILVPSTLNDELGKNDEKIDVTKEDGFVDSGQYYNPENKNEGRYYCKCWANGGPDTHLCIIPITAEVKDGTGNIATKKGAITLAFTGPLEALKSAVVATQTQNNSDADNPDGPIGVPIGKIPPPQAAAVNSASGQCKEAEPVGEGGPRMVAPQQARSWIPISEQMPPNNCPGPKESVPTFTRTACKVNFDDDNCPEKPGYVLCGN